MDERVVNYLIHRSQGDERRSRNYSGGHFDHEDERDYGDERRRRSSRTGRYMRDSRDAMRDSGDDYGERRVHDDYDADEEHLYLSRQDMQRWKRMLKNFDGSTGEHYSLDQVISAASKQGVTFEEYDEKEFCITVNMMYADYGGVLKKYVPPERELHACIDMAKAFLDDVDGPPAAEKLALYFHCVVSAKV